MWGCWNTRGKIKVGKIEGDMMLNLALVELVQP